MPLGRPLLDRLSAMPRFLRACADQLPREEWARPPAPGQFSLVEHCCHLRDLEEEGYLLRIRRMLRETGPALEDFDGGSVAAARNYPAQDLARALQAFVDARSQNLAQLSALGEQELARTGQFGAEGSITLVRLAEMMAAHDAEHRGEIESLFRSLKRPAPT